MPSSRQHKQLSMPSPTNYTALAQWLLQQWQCEPIPVLGISGAQGSGKSTLAALLQHAAAELGIRVGVVSLDDYYLSKRSRQQLASDIHPLLRYRGVPGTHQIDRLRADLQQHQQGVAIKLPRFDKSTDDNAEDLAAMHYDLLLVEGWCLGIYPLTDTALMATSNELELQQDANGVWRQWVNQQITNDYVSLWSMLPSMHLLKAPDWPTICTWRAEAETTLRQETLQGMSEYRLSRFMQTFERWTLALLQGRHAPMQSIWQLDAAHRICSFSSDQLQPSSSVVHTGAQ